jgi:hypothetical protein
VKRATLSIPFLGQQLWRTDRLTPSASNLLQALRALMHLVDTHGQMT